MLSLTLIEESGAAAAARRGVLKGNGVMRLGHGAHEGVTGR
jgi:hypothetical protein